MNKQQTADYYKMSISEYDAMIERLAEGIRKDNARILAESDNPSLITPIFQLVERFGVKTNEDENGQFTCGYYDEVYEYEDREYTFTFWDEGLAGLMIKTKEEKE